MSSSRSRPAQAPLLPGQDRVSGRYAVVRVTFHNPDTGYAVVALTPADDPQGSEIAAVGVFGAPAEGAVRSMVVPASRVAPVLAQSSWPSAAAGIG